jgi:hypothetical protein
MESTGTDMHLVSCKQKKKAFFQLTFANDLKSPNAFPILRTLPIIVIGLAAISSLLASQASMIF